jgi:hypothetical protein
MHADTDLSMDALAAIALRSVGAEYPFHLVHLARSNADVRVPRRLHPVFHGAYDWHSSAHMHWSLVRCLRLHPDADWAPKIAAHFNARFTVEAVAGECGYFTASGRTAFERPFGWAWLLLLAVELEALASHRVDAQRWRDALAPLATLLAGRLISWLPRAQFAVRTGTHNNSAFALILAQRFAAVRDAALADAIAERALSWFGADRRYPADYEPGGDDFLSGGLCEALLMARLLPADRWAAWWSTFAPADSALERWLRPVPVSDASDPKIVHLHGLNLSRAWCWRQLLPLLPGPLQARAAQAAQAQVQASQAVAVNGEYVGTHWLASFVLLARTGDALAAR